MEIVCGCGGGKMGGEEGGGCYIGRLEHMLKTEG